MALKWSNVIVQYSMGVDSLLTSVRLRHVRTEKVRKYLLEYTSALVPCSVDNTSAVLNQTVSLPCLNNAPFNLTHCERRGLLCSGMYKHPSFILMTALSWGDGWTKRKCPYLIERREPWRRTRGYTATRSVCDPKGVSWSQCGKVSVLTALLGRV